MARLAAGGRVDMGRALAHGRGAIVAGCTGSQNLAVIDPLGRSPDIA